MSAKVNVSHWFVRHRKSNKMVNNGGVNKVINQENT